MKTGIHLEGGKVTKKAVDAVADGIVTIFTSAHETRMDQKTVRQALLLLGKLGSVDQASINNCSIYGGSPPPDTQ